MLVVVVVLVKLEKLLVAVVIIIITNTVINTFIYTNIKNKSISWGCKINTKF